MKKLIYALGLLAIFAACRQPPDPAFCWTCTQRFYYNSTDTTPTIIKSDTTRLCDMKQSDIDQHEASNGGQIYSSYTKDGIRCVREQ